HLLFTEFFSQQVDFSRCAGVNAVQDGWAQRSQVVVAQHKTRPNPADAQTRDVGSRRNHGHQFGADVADLAPPHTLGVHLGPPRPWQVHQVGDCLRSQNRAGGVNEYALRTPCPHINTDQHVHVATLRPGATKEWWPRAAAEYFVVKVATQPRVASLSWVSACHGTLAGTRGSSRTPGTVVRHAARGCTARRAPGQ